MQPARAHGHQCHVCRRHWALTLIDHPSGTVVVCRYCATVRAAAFGGDVGAAAARGRRLQLVIDRAAAAEALEA